MVAQKLPDPPAEIDLNRQAAPVPGTELEGHSNIYHNMIHPLLKTTETTYDLFVTGLQKSGDKPCLGHRPWDPATGDYKREYVWLSYKEVEERRTAIGSAVAKLAKDGVLGDGVGVSDFSTAFWSQNRPEFQIFDQSNNAYSRYTVALYESYDQETALYILSHSETRVGAWHEREGAWSGQRKERHLLAIELQF